MNTFFVSAFPSLLLSSNAITLPWLGIVTNTAFLLLSIILGPVFGPGVETYEESKLSANISILNPSGKIIKSKLDGWIEGFMLILYAIIRIIAIKIIIGIIILNFLMHILKYTFI